MNRILLGLGGLLCAPAASAFCGTYIGGVDDSLYNDVSQVVLARQQGQTTLTLANDYSGDLSEFAMVIPVPVVLQPDDVRTVEGDLVATVAKFSEPREVAYTCDDFKPARSQSGLGCVDELSINASADSGSAQPPSDVVIESSFSVGIYDIVVLSAEESSSLMEWLSTNGYGVDASAEALLGEYIDSGAYFFAAKVDIGDQLAGDPEQSTWLEPLQFTYPSEAFSLPIRLGTLNSRGSQDVLIYAFTDPASGSVGISNYPEVNIPRDCMLGPDSDMTDYVNAEFDLAIDNEGGSAWMLEHSWNPLHCDPCTGPVLDDRISSEFGFEGQAWFSRLRVRYDADVTEDLMLYESGRNQQTQGRYIQFNPEVAEAFSFCDSDTEMPDKGYKRCKHTKNTAQSSLGSGLFSAGSVGLIAVAGAAMMRRRREPEDQH